MLLSMGHSGGGMPVTEWNSAALSMWTLRIVVDEWSHGSGLWVSCWGLMDCLDKRPPPLLAGGVCISAIVEGWRRFILGWRRDTMWRFECYG